MTPVWEQRMDSCQVSVVHQGSNCQILTHTDKKQLTKKLSNTDTNWLKATVKFWHKLTKKTTVQYWHKLTKSDCQILTHTDKKQLSNTDTNWQKAIVKYWQLQLSNTNKIETDAKQSNITESNEECIECVDKINNKQPARPPYIELSLPRIKLHRDGQIYLR